MTLYSWIIWCPALTVWRHWNGFVKSTMACTRNARWLPWLQIPSAVREKCSGTKDLQNLYQSPLNVQFWNECCAKYCPSNPSSTKQKPRNLEKRQTEQHQKEVNQENPVLVKWLQRMQLQRQIQMRMSSQNVRMSGRIWQMMSMQKIPLLTGNLQIMHVQKADLPGRSLRAMIVQEETLPRGSLRVTTL